jgi:Fur family ferric uptake transcriptional regulator
MSDTDVLIKRSGLRNTKQRKAILDIIRISELPVTAEDVYLELKKQHIPVNLSTVYRTMETMSECMLIKKLRFLGEEKTFFEYFKAMHRHYLVCLRCKKILPISGCPLKSYEKTLEEKTDYSISGHRLDIYGYCPQCKETDNI